MSQLTDNLYSIASIKSDIKSAIEAKGVDMTGMSFPDYPGAIASISTAFVTETLSVSVNGTYTPSAGIDGFSQVVVDVPQSVTGFTEKEITEKSFNIVNLSNSASFVASHAFANNSTIETVNLPDVSIINQYAFQSTKIKEISIATCQSISQYAFQQCMQLSYVNAPACNFISQYAFNNCNNLKDITLPACSNIGRNAFYACQQLESVSLPVLETFNGNSIFANTSLKSLTLCTETYVIPSYSQGCFNNTPLLSGNGSIYVDAGQYGIFITADGWSSLASLFVSVGSDSTPMIGMNDGILYGKTTSISGTFYNMYSINKVDILGVSLPNCSSVVNYTFQSCSNMTNASLPVCNMLGNNVFQDCYSLQSVYCPNCSSLGTNTFQNCYSLVSIYMPNCEYVGQSAFTTCSSLESIELPACSYISQSAFRNCSSLKTVSLPACEYVGNSAFSGAGVETLSLPVCSYIGQGAFYEDHNLSYVNLSVCSTLDQYAFYNCTSLTTIVLGYSSIVSIPNGAAFTNIYNTITSIYVPASLVDSYKVAPYWNQLSSKFLPIE